MLLLWIGGALARVPRHQRRPHLVPGGGGSTATTSSRAERKGPNVVIAGGAALVASGATLLVVNGAHSAYYAGDVVHGDLDALRSRTNTFVIASAGTGVAAVGLGIGAVVAGHW